MRKVANFCDYFVICSGNSDRQVRAIADNIDEKLESLGVKIRCKEGFREGTWVVLDIGAVVVHIFHNAMREFYNLEYLWQEAKKVNWKN